MSPSALWFLLAAMFGFASACLAYAEQWWFTAFVGGSAFIFLMNGLDEYERRPWRRKKPKKDASEYSRRAVDRQWRIHPKL